MNAVFFLLFVFIASIFSLPQSPAGALPAPQPIWPHDRCPYSLTVSSKNDSSIFDSYQYVASGKISDIIIEVSEKSDKLNQGKSGVANYFPPTHDMLITTFGLAVNLHCLGFYHRYLALDKNYGPGNKALVDGTNTGGNINNVFYPAIANLKNTLVQNNFVTDKARFEFRAGFDDSMYHANLLCAIAERQLGVKNI